MAENFRLLTNVVCEISQVKTKILMAKQTLDENSYPRAATPEQQNDYLIFTLRLRHKPTPTEDTSRHRK